MPAVLNAIGMVLLILLSILALLRLPRTPRPDRRLFPAIAIPLAYALLGTVCASHLCDAGDPYLQVYVPAAFLAPVLYLLRPPARGRLALVIAVLGAVLMFHADSAVHNGFPMQQSRHGLLVQKIRLASAIRLSGLAELPAGPISPEILHQADLDLDPQGRVLVPAIRAHWYTFLTGMYEQYSTPKLAHFDGGPTGAMDLNQRIHFIDPTN